MLTVPTDLRGLLYRERRLLTRNRTNLLLGLSSSLIYICLFGSSITKIIPSISYRSHSVRYLDFALPSLLVFSMIAGATTSASALFQERLGRMDIELWSYPVRPRSYVAAKVIASVGMVLLQTGLAIAVALVIFDLRWSLSHVPMMLLSLAAAASALSGGYMLLATRVSDFQRFSVTINVVGPVMLFASDSFYPLKSMPLVLQAVARINPLTYGVRAVRDSILYGADGATMLTVGLLFVAALACWGLVARSLVSSATAA